MGSRPFRSKILWAVIEDFKRGGERVFADEVYGAQVYPTKRDAQMNSTDAENYIGTVGFKSCRVVKVRIVEESDG